ncbi:transcription termination/antitermination protein NusG [Naumannella halotolerans]|uniref:Transcription termination/antitermination protein NusG n=1 Tax=Naumannella halotolerans TaxID=993414 RepID=A0A4R7JCG1_9ACTN|nr:transcription termination/antitermination protein NusG [Naumannella halotolerans]TDT34397.1 transcriptional antiterminator NusG [Naumannella halotolerans]
MNDNERDAVADEFEPDNTATEPEIDLGPTDDTNDDLTSEGDFEIDLGPFDAESEDTGIDLGTDNAGGEPEVDLSLDDEAEEEDSAEADDAAEKALAELREELASKFGDWYVVHTYSGMENRVQQNLENRATSLNMEDYIFEVRVPTEEVTEIRNGAKKTVKRTVLPGYVLVRMDLTDESWAAVRHTPSVTGFVGHATSPVPLSLEEVEKMLAPSVIAAATAGSEGGKQKKKQKKIEVADYTEGDSVMVIDGPFAGVHATITEINANSQRLKALVEILGRETPVDLSFSEIEKV